IGTEIDEKTCVLRIKSDGLFKTSRRLRPFSLPPLNGAYRHVSLRSVRQTVLGNFKFRQRPLVISITIIVGKAECEESYRKIELKSQCFICIETRFLTLR